MSIANQALFSQIVLTASLWFVGCEQVKREFDRVT